MKNLKTIILTIALLSVSQRAFCESAWINDLKSLFTSNSAVVYAINIRTFNARDNNNNGIIEENLGENKGTFLNAIDRLDELTMCGVNTVLIMPVTTTGKVKALGTAGSLYAPASFDEINPQLKSPNSKLSAKGEMIKFIDECHKRKIRVIVDLPACASYDLYIQRPELFVKDKNNNPVIPADWTDVRLLDAGDNNSINSDVYNLYAGFVDLMQEVNADGIRANVASIKPYIFWKKLINETKSRNPQFLFLAEASSLQKSPSEYTVYTPYEKLLEAGFDGYYGNYSDFKNWKNPSQLYENIKYDMGLCRKYSDAKGILGSFSTHDQVSPMLNEGPEYSKMIIWLNTTLPVNSYYIDGFSTGETYLYPLMNKKAAKTYTDDDYYFVHRGQMDIFNFSKINLGKKFDILQDFILANKIKNIEASLFINGTFTPLKASNRNIFAYERRLGDKAIIVIGNLDFKKPQSTVVWNHKINKDLSVMPIKLSSVPTVTKGSIKTDLAPGETIVVLFSKPENAQ